MTNQDQHKPRRRWLWGAIAGGAVVVVAVAGLSIYGATRGGPSAEPQPTAVPSTSAAGGVDGCLGGAELTAQKLVDAQLSAPQTPEGAVSFAASFARYTLQIPVPTDSKTVATSNRLNTQWWTRWAEQSTSWSGPNPVSATTVNGTYRIDSYTPDEAIITLSLPWVVDGAISPSRTFEPTVTVQRAVGGNWVVSGMDASGEGNKSDAGTTAIPGGC